MGHRPDHRCAVIDVAPEPLLHLVEGLGGHADLGRALHAQRRGVGVPAEALGGRRKGRDRRGEPAGEQIGQGRGHQQAGQEPEQHPLAPGIEDARVAGLHDPPAAVGLAQSQPEGADQHRLPGPLGQFEQPRRLAAAEVWRVHGTRKGAEIGRAEGAPGEDDVLLLDAEVVGDALLSADAEAARRGRRRFGRTRLQGHAQQLARRGRQFAPAQHLLDVVQLVDLRLGSRQHEDYCDVDQHGDQNAGQGEGQHQHEQRQARAARGGGPAHRQTTGASNM